MDGGLVSGGYLGATWKVDCELGRAEDVQQAGPVRQLVTWCRCPNECSLSGLTHSKVAGIQHSKSHLQSINHIRQYLT